MSQSDASYYRKRAETERRNAIHADRSNVAVIHAELAKLYQALVDEDELRETAREVSCPPGRTC